MTKEFYCNKLLPNREICGEKEVSNFEKGRYSTCKKCRTRLNSEYIKQKKDEDLKDKFKTIDSDNNIKCLIEDTINKYPIYSGCTIVQLFSDLQNYTSEELSFMSERIRENNDLIKKLFEDNKNLTSTITILENKIESLNKNQL